MEMDSKYPTTVLIVYILSVVTGFIISTTLYEYLCHILIPRSLFWGLKALIQTAIIFLYYMPFAIGLLFYKSKYILLRLIGFSFFGIGFGFVLKLLFLLIGAIAPY